MRYGSVASLALACLLFATSCGELPVANDDASAGESGRHIVLLSDNGASFGAAGSDILAPTDGLRSRRGFVGGGILAQSECTASPMQLGCLCTNGADCQSGNCVVVDGVNVCADPCVDTCPEGYNCVGVGGGGGGLTFLCLPRFNKLCQPCDAHTDCESVGEVELSLCLDRGAEGSFCGVACTVDNDCLDGYVCEDQVLPDGSEVGQCVLADSEAVCDCNVVGISLGMTTDCSITNGFGTCSGQSGCTQQGLSACSAMTPAADNCDGVDNDCDGTVDNNPPECDDNNLCTRDICDPHGVGCAHIAIGDLCDDGNPCSTDTCHPTAGCVHGPASGAACNDGRPCTFTDRCVDGVCMGTLNPCDDGNPCTTDACDDALGCQNTPSTGATCNDGDPCTSIDTCVAGVCRGTSVNCDDGDPCTTDSCDTVGGCSHAPASGPLCTDNNACTGNDTCVNGACIGTPQGGCCAVDADCDDANPCTADSCDAGTGTCTNAAGPNGASCNADSDGCTQNDVCIAGDCVAGAEPTCPGSGNPCLERVCLSTGDNTHSCVLQPTPAGGACDDGNPCTVGDFCDGGGNCGSDALLPACCGAAGDCDDGDPCTTDSCNPATGACSHTPAPNGTSCNADGDGCTLNDACSNGVCVAGGAAVCPDDGNPCTTHTCVSLSPHLWSCQAGFAPGGTLCDDGIVCTEGDGCNAFGHCVGWPVANCCTADADCEDGSTCTVDRCLADNGACAHTLAPNGTVCDDGDACSTNDRCVTGTCQGERMACDDGNACTFNQCLGGVCQHPQVGDGATCDDGNGCTVNDTCQGGVCQGTAAGCNDGNPCTVDSCVAGACQHTPAANGAVCDDRNACTTGDTCSGGICRGAPMFCDDGNPCTANSCVNGQCISVLEEDDISCDDGNACTQFDRCVLGVCRGQAIVCNDGDPCTLDACANGVCTSAPGNNGAPCDDGNPCTVGDSCTNGACSGTGVTCNDGNPCTADQCSGGVCTHPPLAANTPCNDGDACTTGDRCNGAGACDGTDMVCEDGNPCTGNWCANGTCVQAPLANGTVCDDGNACTVNDRCTGGQCMGQGLQCNDGNPCTADDCAGGTCINSQLPNGSACTDGDACTTGDVCTQGQCAGTPTICDDGNPCTNNWCANGTCASAPTPDGGACNDGNNCTTNDRCTGGQCAGTQLHCDDGNACTNDACVGGQCAHTARPDGQVCDDGNNCTTNDRCTGGVCGGQGTNCDDGNPCTVDTCENGICRNLPAPVNTACNDHNACTHTDVCNGAGACGGTTIQCPDDGDPCTAHFCQNGTCQTVDAGNGTACTPQAGCFTSGTCQNGTCTGSGPSTCDDGNPCTADGCIGNTCQHSNVANNTACNDGNTCTAGDTCQNGTCTGGPINCEDNNPCTADACVNGACAHVATNPGMACDRPELCIHGGICQGTVCAGGTFTCDDGNDCTTDRCEDDVCRHDSVPSGSVCDDGDPCTTGDSCWNSLCRGTPMICNDNNACTDDICGANGCQHVPLDCDDNNACTADSCQNGACTHTNLQGNWCDPPGDPRNGFCQNGTCIRIID